MEMLQSEHLHHLQSKDGGFVCIDICFVEGRVFKVSWYTAQSPLRYGEHEFALAV